MTEKPWPNPTPDRWKGARFSVRIRNALHRAGIENMEQLDRADVDTIYGLPNIGPVSIEQMRRAVEEFRRSRERAT